MRLTPMVLAVLALSGCAQPAIYRDPVSGSVAQCNATTPGVFPIIAQSEINSCAAAYDRMGWKRQ